MENVRQHFDKEAKEFDNIILRLIPDYSQMTEALVSSIPFDKSASIRVIDLGCGTGTVAEHTLLSYPNALLTCIDFAENMISIARQKLRAYANTKYIVGDFSVFSGEYHVALSSLALHHLLTDEDKRRLYRRIYDSLEPGGVFYDADVVLGSNTYLHKMYMSKWMAFMRRNVTQEEIESKWIPKYEAEDHPAALIDQLAWLYEIGFADLDVIWKHYNFAVYGGRKRK